MAIRDLQTIFSKRANDHLNKIIADIPNELKQHSITHQSTPADLKVIESKIINALWSWPKIEVLDNTNVKNYENIEMSLNEASGLVNGLRYSSNSSTVNMLEITYGLSYSGDWSALTYSVNYPQRQLNITNISKNGFTLYSYYQGTIDDYAAAAKANKVAIVSLINTNQTEVDNFFTGKKEYFEALVEQTIQKAFKDASDKNRGLDLL
jgi:hypothetical protein